MSKRIGTYLRQQHLALLAIFLVLAGGTALAATAPDNSVISKSVRNNALTTNDLRDGVGVRGADVIDGSLEGADIAESTLAQVPSALTALQGGRGRHSSSGGCDPESDVFVSCGTVQISLAAPARLLVVGTAEATTELGANHASGQCRIGTTSGPMYSSTTDFRFVDAGDTTYAIHNVPVTVVTPVLSAGTHTVGVDCNQDPYHGAVYYHRAQVVAVALSDA